MNVPLGWSFYLVPVFVHRANRQAHRRCVGLAHEHSLRRRGWIAVYSYQRERASLQTVNGSGRLNGEQQESWP
jgi:hypothetical protein